MTFTGFPAQTRLPDSGKWLVELDWTSTEARLEPQASSAVWPGVNLRDPSLSLRVTLRKVSCLHSWRWNGKLNPRAMIVFFHFSSCRNFSATVRRDLMRAKYLSLASTSVQGESGVLVFNSISSAAVM